MALLYGEFIRLLITPGSGLRPSEEGGKLTPSFFVLNPPSLAVGFLLSLLGSIFLFIGSLVSFACAYPFLVPLP